MEATAVLEKRRDDLAEGLQNTAPECDREQRHLDEGTEARAYWHFGCLVAVKDALALLGKTNTTRH